VLLVVLARQVSAGHHHLDAHQAVALALEAGDDVRDLQGARGMRRGACAVVCSGVGEQGWCMCSNIPGQSRAAGASSRCV
jgi:hypothetical protein